MNRSGFVEDRFEEKFHPRWVRFAIGHSAIEWSPGVARLVVDGAVAGELSDAEIDDHRTAPRWNLHWAPPLALTVRARFSHAAGELLGTAGALLPVVACFDEPFLVVYGDNLLDVDLTALIRFHRERQALATIGLFHAPDPTRVPPICSMGGLGNFFHRKLIPTLAMISGPWSLYDPVFGADAIDFDRMRNQLLAAGDAILALAALPREQIAGDYTTFRQQAAQGTPTCPAEVYPQFGPGYDK